MNESRPIHFRGGIAGYLRSKRFRKQWRKSLWKPGWKIADVHLVHPPAESGFHGIIDFLKEWRQP